MQWLRREPNAKSTCHFNNGVKSWLGPWGESFVQAFTAKSGIFGNLRHTSCASYIAEGKQKQVGVFCFEHGRHVFGDGFFVIKVTSSIEGDKCG